MSRLRHRRTVGFGVGAGAAVLILLQLAARAWALSLTWFWQDDFIYTNLARTMPFADFVLMDYRGHVQPGQFLLVWGTAQVAPLSWPLHMAIVLVLQLAADLLFLAVLIRLFGRRRAVLVPFAVFLFSPLTLPSLLWFAAAIQWLPLVICLCLLLLLHISSARDGRRSVEPWCLVVLVVALAFWERALILPLAMYLVEALWLSPQSGRARWFAPLRRAPRLWSAYAVLGCVYLVTYRLVTSDVPVRWGSASDTLRLVRETVLVTWIPGLLGGPWTGNDSMQTLAPPLPHPWSWIVVQAALLVVLASLLLRPATAVRAWAVPSALLVVNIVVVAATRLDFLGPVIGRDPRYLADVVPLAALALGVAFLPMTGDPVEGRATGARNGLSGVLSTRWRAGALVAVLVVYLNSAWITTYEAAVDRRDTPAEQWVGTAREELASLPPGVTLFDAPVPASVVASIFGADARASRVLGSLPEAAGRFNQVSDDVRILDAAGRVRPMTVVGASSAPPGPEAACGYRVAGATRQIPTGAPLPASDWLVRIGYYSQTGSPARVDVGGDTYSVQFPAGVGYVYLFPGGPVDGLRVSGVDRTAGVCVTDVVVGRGWPAGQ